MLRGDGRRDRGGPAEADRSVAEPPRRCWAARSARTSCAPGRWTGTGRRRLRPMRSDAFRAAAEAKDFSAVDELFAEDVVFRSPVVFKPYEGREALRVAALRGRPGLRGLRYIDQVEDGDIAMLAVQRPRRRPRAGRRRHPALRRRRPDQRADGDGPPDERRCTRSPRRCGRGSSRRPRRASAAQGSSDARPSAASAKTRGVGWSPVAPASATGGSRRGAGRVRRVAAPRRSVGAPQVE